MFCDPQQSGHVVIGRPRLRVQLLPPAKAQVVVRRRTHVVAPQGNSFENRRAVEDIRSGKGGDKKIPVAVAAVEVQRPGPAFEQELRAEPGNVVHAEPIEGEPRIVKYEKEDIIKTRIEAGNALQYKYLFETDEDKECLDLLFANVDDPNDTIESIINFIISNSGGFSGIETWEDFKSELYKQTQSDKASKAGKEISVMSWRKFYRLFNKSYQKCQQMFTNKLGSGVRLRDQIAQIHKNDVMVIDVAKLDEESQGFVFGDVMRAVYNLKLGSTDRVDSDIPDRIVIFIDELNKYASTDVPKSSPILHQLLDITERGRSLGIVLFGAEQFVSDIHRRIKGNCATQAFGRTNAIEISREDFRFVPSVYKTMLTRMKQGEYIIQNPVFRSMLNIKFPLPIYKYFD